MEHCENNTERVLNDAKIEDNHMQYVNYSDGCIKSEQIPSLQREIETEQVEDF